MLYLYPNSAKIIKAKKEFLAKMLDLIYVRIDNIESIENVNHTAISIFFSNIINKDLEDILVGSPGRLKEINDQINPFLQLSNDFRKGVEHVFNYDWFIKKTVKRYGAYDLAEALDISTCIYCNRNYTNTVISSVDKSKITRPQFDHYFDKASNPILSISFFNLIPSCTVCNSSVKNIQKFNLIDYSHPYLDDLVDDVKFTYKYSNKTKSGLKVKVSSAVSIKAQNTLEAFAIEEVYNSHTGELLDLLKTRQYFSEKYLDILTSNLLKDVIVSKEELYMMVFGVEFNKKDFHNRPFSKFKSDILVELGIII
jgi:hypothetical protein